MKDGYKRQTFTFPIRAVEEKALILTHQNVYSLFLLLWRMQRTLFNTPFETRSYRVLEMCRWMLPAQNLTAWFTNTWRSLMSKIILQKIQLLLQLNQTSHRPFKIWPYGRSRDWRVMWHDRLWQRQLSHRKNLSNLWWL